MILPEKTLKEFMRFQQNELSESIVYNRLASIGKSEVNRNTLHNIAKQERSHYERLKKHTQKNIAPNRLRIFKFFWLAQLLGITFAIKLMEANEKDAYSAYTEYTHYPDLQKLSNVEEVHEKKLIGMTNEERLEYMNSVVLVSSEYLLTKSGGDQTKHPTKAAIYTDIAYIITTTALVSPFIFISNVLVVLGVILATALFIIALFNYYYAIARNENFHNRFTEMAVLSFSVAAMSFLIGYPLETFTGPKA